MKKAIIYYRQNDLILHAMSQTIAGFWIMSEPFLKINESAETEIVPALFAALDGSINDIPNPTDWKDFQKPLFKVAGVKSLKSFHQGCLACHLEQDEIYINFTPTRNLGGKEGFEEILDAKISILNEVGSSEILATLKKALSKCE